MSERQAHRFRVGQSLSYVEPDTGKRYGCLILCLIHEDDGSPVYGAMLADGRKTCVPESRLDDRVVIDWIDCPTRLTP